MKPARKRNDDLKPADPNRAFPAPRLPYAPAGPRRYRPRIGLIGCGGITRAHLDAYRTAGWEVVALCDLRETNARERQKDYYPGAEVFTDHTRLLARTDIDVVDVALHPAPRAAVIEDALLAGKHVLSQKPFVLDLEVGERLVRLADQCGRRLAVNQNGRWAPYVRYLQLAVERGLIGTLQSVAFNLNWDHTWIRGTAFESVHHIVLYDFAIHWFDMVALFFGQREPLTAFAVNARAPGQLLAPPLLGQALLRFDEGLASLNFDAHSRFAPEESVCLTGSEGTLRARGPLCLAHEVTLTTRRGVARPPLTGKWFNDGFRGTMGELLRAIEEDREPTNSARNNLRSLALCFAAVRAADTGRVQVPGKVRRLPAHAVSA